MVLAMFLVTVSAVTRPWHHIIEFDRQSRAKTSD